MNTRSYRFAPEVRERAVRMVQEHRADYPSLWAAVQSIAPKICCTAETLQEWVKRTEIDAGQRAGTTTAVMHRIKELEREVKELRRANEVLKTASAFFALVGSTANSNGKGLHRLLSRHFWGRAHLQSTANGPIVLLASCGKTT